ncbi:MAG: restriction endonuclease subunit S [Moorea sp. SIO4A3]|nr:restriction endonuclease subunit S [Moorena sp. SIO4A3]
MNQFPDGWTVKPLGEVATLQRGFDLPIHKRISGKIPVFAANGAVGFHNESKIQGPGVVTGRSGTLGKVNYVESDYWPLNTSLWVKNFHGNDPKWVFRLLSWMKLETHTRGTGVPTLNRNLIHVLPVPLPPLEEQKRIAAILDKADSIRRKRKDAIALTEELLRSTFIDMFGDPVTNPKGWDVKPLSELCIKITDGTHKTPKYVDEGVPFLSARNIKAHQIDWINTKFIKEDEHKSLIKRCYPEYGDVLLTKSGNIGDAAMVNQSQAFSLFESVALIKINNKASVNPLFLTSLLNTKSISNFYKKNTKGIAVKHLHLVDIRKIPTIVPPQNNQNAFIKKTEKIKRIQSKALSHMNFTENLFNSLLQKAFRGEI